MAENADTIASFDHEIREVVQAAIDNEISRPAIAGVIMSMAADFNTNKPLLAAYAEEKKEAPVAAPKAKV